MITMGIEYNYWSPEYIFKSRDVLIDESIFKTKSQSIV